MLLLMFITLNYHLNNINTKTVVVKFCILIFIINNKKNIKISYDSEYIFHYSILYLILIKFYLEIKLIYYDGDQ
jgi:hypothetical protein